MAQRITGPYEPKPTGPELPNQRKFDDIAAHKGQRELLLVFSPSPAKTPYKHTMRDLDEHWEDLESRGVDLLLVLETGRAPKAWNYLPGQQGVKARYRFGIGTNDFAVILLGLDGRIKHRWNDAVEYDELVRHFA
jgi:Domain of unknown function (DUF4174)